MSNSNFFISTKYLKAVAVIKAWKLNLKKWLKMMKSFSRPMKTWIY